MFYTKKNKVFYLLPKKGNHGNILPPLPVTVAGVVAGIPSGEDRGLASDVSQGQWQAFPTL